MEEGELPDCIGRRWCRDYYCCVRQAGFVRLGSEEVLRIVMFSRGKMSKRVGMGVKEVCRKGRADLLAPYHVNRQGCMYGIFVFSIRIPLIW